ncbi:MAG: DUF2203 family protein [Deltaproteobacteria bacterium]|nr:DUF2203 family protein [Deltaproteobacteria bacterium]
MAAKDLERFDQLIPQLEAVFANMDALRQEVTARANELERMGYAASRKLKAEADPPEISDRRALLETAKNRLIEEGRKFEGLGVTILDLDLGIVGLRSEVDGERVFLSWQRGEPSVRYFHALDADFRARRRLPG